MFKYIVDLQSYKDGSYKKQLEVIQVNDQAEEKNLYHMHHSNMIKIIRSPILTDPSAGDYQNVAISNLKTKKPSFFLSRAIAGLGFPLKIAILAMPNFHIMIR
ncbi:hypothetical protein GIB67_006458 [Kingdonia uniflora]|uniref:Uncharacterized protein n=1 Tax=Kingdonia uniflora TaxID=39325 RepID=A0A7J7NFC3_9MAGN|nr:hypothetical protein GIB67_006458 [Kingdonia uniflora]